MTPAAPSLPDFRNLGVMLRAALLAEAVNLAVTFSQASGLASFFERTLEQAALYEPTLLTTLLLLFLLAPGLKRLPYRQGAALTLLLAAMVALAWQAAMHALLPESFAAAGARPVLVAVLVGGLVLIYFDWRQRRLSPALAEARLMALQARIRPHFLFNSLNTVLGLIRADPRRAEAVLENLAELFRALMADSRTLVPLARELELARAYAEIESIRLGDRLAIDWQCASAPLDARVPPLILQPLLENAVYHGVESNPAAGGVIRVELDERADRLVIVLRNPVAHAAPVRPGNRMALSNIRERLDLHYDAEARMSTGEEAGQFVVRIELPLQRSGSDPA